ncbi:hypothetical protein ACFVWY_28460 [Streptomyces sp. NPDC058195]|uniref:hypothetical protein n=1 Tax=Streptomyces sp. NPDC058195 TaxID=3346375 RepID=UPI0036E2CF54
MPESSTAAGPGSTDPDAPSAVVLPLSGAQADVGAAADRPEATTRAAPTALQVLRSLDSGPRGLLEEQAGDRLARCDENVLPA